MNKAAPVTFHDRNNMSIKSSQYWSLLAHIKVSVPPSERVTSRSGSGRKRAAEAVNRRMEGV